MRFIIEKKKIRIKNGAGEFTIERPIAELIVTEIAGYLNIILRHSKFTAWFPATISKSTKIKLPKKYAKLFDHEVFPEVEVEG